MLNAVSRQGQGAASPLQGSNCLFVGAQVSGPLMMRAGRHAPG